MQLTNVLGLPQAIVDAVANDDYDRGASDITVTELIDPPRKVAIEAAHAGEISEDASDRIWALLGSVAHGILERANVTDSVEERLYASVEGWQLGGKYDHLALTDDPTGRRVLSDYKLVSVWEVIRGLKHEKVEQLNILGWLARQHGYRVDDLEAVCLLRDWSKSNARRDPSYPQRQVVRYPVPLWTDMEIEFFLSDRMLKHQMARLELPECSDDERWYSGTTYAVKKKKNKRATRVLPSMDEALAWANINGLVGCTRCGLRSTSEVHELRFVEPGEGRLWHMFEPGTAELLDKDYEVIERIGVNTRCELYCSALAFCEQGQALLSTATSEEESDG